MAAPRKRPGPAPYPTRLVRSRTVQVPVNAGELATIRRVAGGKGMAAWARAILLAATEAPSPIHASTKKGAK